VAFARPDICAYRNPDESSPRHPVLLITIHFKVILPSTPGFHKRSLSYRFLHQIIICISLLQNPVLEHPRSLSVNNGDEISHPYNRSGKTVFTPILLS